jgi:transcription initiation factor IIE alpha subunit
LPSHATQILEAILYRSEIPRGEMLKILNVTDRHARRITSSLIEKGIITSDTPKSPIKLAFSAALASRWMPGLFPPTTD